MLKATVAFFVSLRRNTLLRADLAQWSAAGLRHPLTIILLVALFAQVSVCANLEITDDLDEGYLFYIFTGFHAFLQLFLPFWAFVEARGHKMRESLDVCVLTGIPREDYFWRLWCRVALPATAFILVLYLPLLGPFPWLRASENFLFSFDKSDNSFESAYHIGRLLSDLLCVALFASPWIARRFWRIFIWTLAVLCFYVATMAEMRDVGFMKHLPRYSIASLIVLPGWSPPPVDSNTPPFFSESRAFFHPAITLSYFLTSIMWSTAVGVAVGLYTRLRFWRAVGLVTLCAPLLEWGALHAVHLEESEDLYDGWMFLYGWLVVYTTPCAALLMAIKWNAFIWIARKARRIEPVRGG